MSSQTMIDESGNEFIAVHLSTEGFRPWTGEKYEKIACMPDAVDLHSVPSRGYPYLRTNWPADVTCPICKRTNEFSEAARQQRMSSGCGQRVMT